MRRLFYYFLFPTVACLLLSSCKKEDISRKVSWKDVSLEIDAVNAERSSLFNAADEAHYIGDDIVGLVFLGENYPLVEEPEEKSTNHPCLYIKKDYRSYYLCFGPLDGELDMDEDLVIQFKNGVQWIIRYRCCDHDEVSLSCTREWYFNGEKTYNPMHLRPTS